MNRIANSVDLQIYAKMEMLNPSGSVKDRAARQMLLDAESRGLLHLGSTLVESSSGNLGISIATMANARGYRCIFIAQSGISPEKLELLRLLGAKVIVGDPNLPPDDPHSLQSILDEIIDKTPNAVHLNQYSNQMNPEAHYRTTGPEIFEQSKNNVDYVVCTMGTGGTISGIGKFLKEKTPNVKVIGVDPEGSILSKYICEEELVSSKLFYIEAIGRSNFIPSTLWKEYVDDVVTVSDAESMEMTRQLSASEGILAGWSSGAAMAAALKFAKSSRCKGRMIVILPDGLNRYLRKFTNWRYSAAIEALGGSLGLADILMSKKRNQGIVAIPPWNSLGSALELSLKEGVERLIVIKDNDIVGKIERGKIVSLLSENPVYHDMPLKYFADDPFPIVQLETPLNIAIKNIEEHGCVVVCKRNLPIGVITRSDLASLNYWQMPMSR